METVEALLSLSDCSRSPETSPEKSRITLIPAHNPDKGTVFGLSKSHGSISLLSTRIYRIL